jgi:hypothetical protein
VLKSAFEKLAQLSSAAESVELVTLSHGLPESIATGATWFAAAVAQADGCKQEISSSKVEGGWK